MMNTYTAGYYQNLKKTFLDYVTINYYMRYHRYRRNYDKMDHTNTGSILFIIEIVSDIIKTYVRIIDCLAL